MKVPLRFGIALLLAWTRSLDSAARAQMPGTERVNIATGGAQSDADSSACDISRSGRFVSFASLASNLVIGDTNGYVDIFVRDRTAGTTERVNVSTGGAQTNLNSQGASISADGRFVAFMSGATNLVVGDTNGCLDVFVRDRVNGTTERVSVDSAGVQGNNTSSAALLSADGRFVAFNSYATNLVTGDTNGCLDVFVRDRQNGTTERVSVSTSGVEANLGGGYPSISADGQCVAFWSTASNLVAGDTNGVGDVFVRNRTSGATERVSVSTGGTQANSSSFATTLSADGRYVAFESAAWNLVVGDTNGSTDIFLRDRTLATTERVSVATSGMQGETHSVMPSISDDGRFVAFQSKSRSLVAGDSNSFDDVFVRDRQNATTERWSVDSAGAQADQRSLDPAISANGRCVAFISAASNLVPFDTNAVKDIFVRDRGLPTPDMYCTSGTSSNGCAARITASVNPSVSLAHACTITVTNVEGLRTGIVFYGIGNAGFSPAPWASGSTSFLCVKQPTQRTPAQNSGGTFAACNGAYSLDWNSYQSSHPFALGNPWSVGDKVYVQAWFRDPPAVKSTNLSNAVEMMYVP